jgi:hypothetical protein
MEALARLLCVGVHRLGGVGRRSGHGDDVVEQVGDLRD